MKLLQSKTGLWVALYIGGLILWHGAGQRYELVDVGEFFNEERTPVKYIAKFDTRSGNIKEMCDMRAGFCFDWEKRNEVLKEYHRKKSDEDVYSLDQLIEKKRKEKNR